MKHSTIVLPVKIQDILQRKKYRRWNLNPVLEEKLQWKVGGYLVVDGLTVQIERILILGNQFILVIVSEESPKEGDTVGWLLFSVSGVWWLEYEIGIDLERDALTRKMYRDLGHNLRSVANSYSGAEKNEGEFEPARFGWQVFASGDLRVLLAAVLSDVGWKMLYGYPFVSVGYMAPE